ncbi:hypothetical protein [Methylobacterium pseudosasicola]|uniref:Uncharacterized protein n=1 Tax=Methylobacterium pseudosasicola TaxID=582667 RepID=A0A1I4LM86_9HYPH|nr:hypothetical protein [Methylobacterium pseudosasicola]SFL92134.1 hypothetical protein SAMN05192568_10147 [Methylobacterium pseudosasicola]
MALSEPVHVTRRLGTTAQVGAIVMAEQAIDTYLDGYGRPDDRAIALDILLRDLARLRFLEPDLDGFVGEVERYIDLLYRDLSRRAA